MIPRSTGYAAPSATIALVIALNGPAFAGGGADVIVSQINGTANFGFLDPTGTGDYISAFSLGTESCNIGDTNLDWYPSPASNQHPVIAEGVFRLAQGRFEQIGRSWLKHGFLVINDDGCGGGCTQQNSGPLLFPGCSDVYLANLNGTRTNIGPTFEVNAHTGFFPARLSPVNSSTNISSRLQIHNRDIDPSLNPGALYFGQAHYVHPNDAFSGNGDNNASFIRVSFSPPASQPEHQFLINLAGGMQPERCAIRAWKDDDPSVVETDVRVPGEGLFILAARVTVVGNGFYR